MEFGGPTLSTFLLRKHRSVLEMNTLVSVIIPKVPGSCLVPPMEYWKKPEINTSCNQSVLEWLFSKQCKISRKLFSGLNFGKYLPALNEPVLNLFTLCLIFIFAVCK